MKGRMKRTGENTLTRKINFSTASYEDLPAVFRNTWIEQPRIRHQLLHSVTVLLMHYISVSTVTSS